MGQPPQAGQAQQPVWQLMVMPALLLVIFYFALIRPQQMKQKEHAALLKEVKKDDKIITTGGVIAVVVTVKEKTLTVRSADAKFEITKSAIAEITERSGEPTQS